MKRNIKNYVLYDDTTVPEYSEYVEHCRINGHEIEGENSQAYWDFASRYHENDWDDLKVNLKCSKEANQPVLLLGTLGLWNGKRTIFPTRCENLMQAIEKCVGRGVDNMKVYVENGIVYVEAYHHDGTNYFEIYKLSSKGLSATSKWYDGNAGCEDYKGYWLAKFHGYLF